MYLLSRRQSSAAVMTLVPPPRIPLAPSPAPAPSPVAPQETSAQRIVDRLRSDFNARLVWYFQAILYSFGYTNANPDGAVGPVTTQMISDVQQMTGNDVTGQWDPSAMLPMARNAMAGWSGGASPSRFVLNSQQYPSDLLSQIQGEAQAVDPNAFPVVGTLTA